MEERQASSEEARRDFRALLNAVEVRGDHVTITRYGTATAVIVPIGWYEQVMKQLALAHEEAAARAVR